MEITMLQNLVQSTDHLPIGELPSPLSNQILEFQESDLFSDTLQNSDVASNSNCCCYEEQSSYPTTTQESFNQDLNDYAYTLLMNDEPPDPTMTSSSASAAAAQPLTTSYNITNNSDDINHSNYSFVFDSTEDNENDITVSIDFNNVTNYLDNQQNHFDYSVPIIDSSIPQYPMDLPPVYEDDCLAMSMPPPYTRFANSTGFCSMLDPSSIGSYLPPGSFSAALNTDNTGILPSGCFFLGSELPSQELDFLGGGGDSSAIHGSDTMQRVRNFTSELQAINNESQHFVNGGANSTSLAPEITSLEDPSFKVGKLSAEERREKIHRYMKKRNERNFSKKIKYVCRKTLADSRPRVRGRFAKNDELEMMPRTTGTISYHEEDTDEEVVVKDEDDIVNSSDIFAHISGINSFKFNNPLQSWI